MGLNQTLHGTDGEVERELEGLPLSDLVKIAARLKQSLFSVFQHRSRRETG